MNNWRPQATISIICAILLALLLLACRIFDGAPWAAGGFYMAILAAIVIAIVGIASGLSGAREGSPASRMASKVCIVLLALPFLAVACFLLWIAISNQRWA